MTIRKTTVQDLPAVMQIYEDARAYMQESGNLGQWQDGHPPQALIEQDIRQGSSYVCVDDGKILAIFYFAIEEDPTYGKIDGSWLNDKPYGVVHRIACGPKAKGTGAFCMDWCFSQHPNVRVDTHKDNIPMKKLLEKLDYSYCGIIWLANGDERMAYQKVL